MKVSLLHHEDAGDGVSSDALVGRIERAGHQVVQVVDKDADLEDLLAGPTELLVAAGGDGTVWRAARAVAGHATPMAILPLGTANNVAHSLDIEGSTGQIIHGWAEARLRPLDLGIARGAWGASGFIEAVGSGLVSGGIDAMDGKPPSRPEEDTDARLARAVRTYRDVLSRLQPRRWRFVADGHEVEGDFILLEVLNIRSVGPNLVLAPEANPSDGRFEVVAAGEEHREHIDEYLRQRLAGREGRLRLPTRRARRVEIVGWDRLHLDDQVCAGPSMDVVSIEIEPAAVRLLI